MYPGAMGVSKTMKLPSEFDLIPYATGTLPGRRWLVLAPHPDDETLGPGATLAAAARCGVDVHVIVASDGGRQGEPTVRRAETARAMVELGLGEPEFFSFEDRGLAGAGVRVRAAVAAALARTSPDLVLVTSPVDLHPDHRVLARAVQSAVRRLTWGGLRYRGPAWIAAYEVTTPLRPNLLTDCDATWEAKRRAALCHGSQIAVRPYVEVMDALGLLRSMTLDGVGRAEAFFLAPAARVARWSIRQWAAEMGSAAAWRRVVG